jgi:hypothetical protein
LVVLHDLKKIIGNARKIPDSSQRIETGKSEVWIAVKNRICRKKQDN